MACDSGPALHDMTPPKADVAAPQSAAADAAAVSSCLRLETLKQRADFLRAAKARRVGCAAFMLQARESEAKDVARVGFTCSKKIGNAVARNRAKRRLRAVARAVMPSQARPGWDYVLVGRPGATVSHDFAAMCDDLHSALRKLHGGTP
jgi:ribonuclease P protein component